jgi:anti-sigma-K factor RskA
MNYSDETISALAAEYVIGTLRGSARDRFDALKAKNPKMQEEVWYWEGQLNQMAIDMPATEPRPELWQKISQQLNLSNNVVNLQQPKAEAKPSSSVWQWVSSVAVAASIVMAVLLINSMPKQESLITSVAVFSNEQAEILWSVDISEKELTIKPTQKLPLLSNNDYQLWIVPKSGGDPISISLLPQRGQLILEQGLALDLSEIAALAVSLEPLGGSPTGQPTEVLFATEIVLLSS